MADAEFAVERCAHQLLRNERLGLGNARIGLVICRLRGIGRRLRTELARRELLGAIQRQLRAGSLRLEARQIALVGSVEQLQQRTTAFTLAPAVNMMSVMRPETSEVTLT